MVLIPWEINAAGDCAALKARKVVKKTPARLRIEATERMTGVTLVSAEFGGVPRVFETKIWILLEKEGSVEFFGIYVPSFLGEEDGLPCLCVRKGVWSKNNASCVPPTLENYGLVSSYFFRKESVEGVIAKISKIADYISNGLKLVSIPDRMTNGLSSIRLFFNADVLSLEVEYSPMVKCESRVERELDELMLQLSRLDMTGVLPDKASHKISYKSSVFGQHFDVER